MSPNPRKNLIRILQNAHAGEIAAAYAYRGHWRSLRLLDMARVEVEHEAFFHETVVGHRLLPVMKRVFGWS